MAVYSCDQCSFKSNYRSSLIRHLRNIHGEDRLPQNLPLETYSEPVKQPTKQKLVEFSKAGEYYPTESKNKDLANYLIEERHRKEETRRKQDVGFIVTISLLGLVFALVWFRDSLIGFYKSWKADQGKVKETTIHHSVETNETDDIGQPIVQILPRQSTAHDQRPYEPLH